MVLFKFYFFKENNRNYDVSDLLAFFSAIPNITIDKQKEDRRILYKNSLLNFSADFVISSKSVVSNLQRLNPKYLDVNIRLEMDILLQEYKLEILTNIVEAMCKRFSFFVYNEVFEDVSPYRRTMLLKAFQMVKEAYKKTYEDEISKYYKLDPINLNGIYSYIEQRENFVKLYATEKIIPLEYLFYGQKGMRQAFISVKWNGVSPFVMPPNVDIITIYENKTVRMIPYKEFESKVSKYLKPVPSNIFGMSVATPKTIKKIHSILLKTKFSVLTADLLEIDFNKILDI